MALPSNISRPDKFTHAQTVLYEIDMLKFAAGELERQPSMASWRNLECFLLHFRNLIEFFGKTQPRDDSLSMYRPESIWTDATMPSAEVLSRLRREDLWTKYEGPGLPDKISRYLQHCTEQRVDGKTWDVQQMYNELDPLMSEFENVLPDRSRSWNIPPNPSARVIAMQGGYTTATVEQSTVFPVGMFSESRKK